MFACALGILAVRLLKQPHNAIFFADILSRVLCKDTGKTPGIVQLLFRLRWVIILGEVAAFADSLRADRKQSS